MDWMNLNHISFSVHIFSLFTRLKIVVDEIIVHKKSLYPYRINRLPRLVNTGPWSITWRCLQGIIAYYPDLLAPYPRQLTPNTTLKFREILTSGDIITLDILPY